MDTNGDQGQETTVPQTMTSTDDELDSADEELEDNFESCSSEISTKSTEVQASEDYSCFEKAKRWLRTLYKGARSLVGLIILLVLYSVIGAALFMWIESRYEQKYKSNIVTTRNILLERLSNLSHVLDNSEWKASAVTMLVEYESAVREAVKNDVVTDSTVNVWNFWGALFFTFTVYTSIGYGNIVPVTSFGRILTVIYAAIGIPICFLLLADLGRRFTVAIKFLWAFVRRFYFTGYCRRIWSPFQKKDLANELDKNGGGMLKNDAKTGEEVSENRSGSEPRIIYGYEVDGSFNLPISVAIAILFFYILMGAMMYSIWEKWQFVEAVYFVFVSLATIGFGDVLPKHQKFFIFSSIYMFVGLSLVSMCITVAVDFFSEQANRAKQRMGKAKKKIGAQVSKVQKKTRERVAEIKTNIVDETLKIKQKTDEKWTFFRTNIANETTNFHQETDEKTTGIKPNISDENAKIRKMAEAIFIKNSSVASFKDDVETSTEMLHLKDAETKHS